MKKVKRITVSLPTELVREFEKAIARKAYSKRSKAVADILRDFLAGIEWQKGGSGVGVITILYNHHILGTTERLTELQHAYGALILSSLHVHLDHDNCLEVIIAKGNATEIEELANTLTSTRGVKQGKLACIAFPFNKERF